MSLVTCAECGKEKSDSAVACPHCGYRTPPKPRYIGRWVVGSLIAFGLWVWAMQPRTPQAIAKNSEREAVSSCKDQQSMAADRRDGTAGVVAATCQKMESDYTTKYGTRP